MITDEKIGGSCPQRDQKDIMSTRDFGEDPDSKTLVPASLRKGAYTTDKDERLRGLLVFVESRGITVAIMAG